MNNQSFELAIARYNENSEQARHHERLRERTTRMVATTIGILLGLLSFKETNSLSDDIVFFASSFIMILSCWGVYYSIYAENRIRRHRDRIDKIRASLDSTFTIDKDKKRTTIWVWVLFHIILFLLGFILFVYSWCDGF